MSGRADKLVWIYAIIFLGFMLIGCSSNDNSTMQVSAVNGLNFDTDNGSITVPEGFGALVVADDLGRGRHMVVRENGDIFVALRELHDGSGIAALRDTTGDGRADIVQYFGEEPGTGIGIRNGYLYFGTDQSIIRWELGEDELVPDGAPETIVEGFPEQGPHAAKPFTFDNAGNIYVNVGAPSNACMEQGRTPGSPGMDPCPQLERHAGIWQFSADLPGQTQVDDGYRYASITFFLSSTAGIS